MSSSPGRPLIKKLGIKSGQRAFFLETPPHYFDLLGPLPEGLIVEETLSPSLNFIHFFVKEQEWLKESFPALKYHMDLKGMIWISWPKGTSKVDTDLNGNIVREIGLGNGLVDIKVCSVDDTWSALKFTYRRKDRS